ncbi:ABC-three component system middle component 2, partial [Acinetobacter stercoris]|uniref:ABC-three component system middle component 2 n=1 Tax=Acinetobacter stercoris TaxID=2126983 RepID=UPI0011B1F268
MMKIYNNPLELGIRGCFAIYYNHPIHMTINKIAYLDYMTIYSKKFIGIESLHPEVPMHQMEFLLRFELLKNGLNQMIKKNFLNISYENYNLYYIRGENLFSFINLLDSDYHIQLLERSKRVIDTFGHLSEGELY